MPDSSDQPTQKSDPPRRDASDGETRTVPPAPEPGTLSAHTHSHLGDPPTMTQPSQEREAGWVDPPGFVIVRELGSGGMGVVYEAKQTRLNRLVALKVLRGRGGAQDVVRFLAEAEAVAAIKHPHVVQVFEIGQSSSAPFIALELLTGGTLSEKLRDGRRFAPREAASLVAKLAGAVQAAHDLGIVHRDLKPGNVLFDERGEPKITDFGLAKRAGGAELTRTQAVMGTPAYMAPEQARGEARFVGPAADVWALGAILYECLTGKRAFDADDTWAVLRKVTDEAPPAPRAHVPGLPRDLELIALKCLEKNPADRYPSAAALASDLESYLAGRSVTVRPAGPRERFMKWCRRNPAIASFTAALLVVAFLGFAGVTWGFLRAEERGVQLAKANDDLTRTNGDLAKVNNDLKDANDSLKKARDTQARLNEVLQNARAGLIKQATELIDANAAAGERGYLSDISLAHQLWKANDLRGMRAALDRCPPGYRRWEWHYLNRLSRPERDTIPTAAIPLALAFSPDGKYLTFITLAGELSVREAATGKEVHHFAGGVPDAQHFAAIAFRPDHKELAFVVGDRFWTLNLETWERQEQTLKQDQNPRRVIAVGYTADGRLLRASTGFPKSGQRREIVIRDERADKTLATLEAEDALREGPITEVGGATFSPDGTRFAASVVDTGIRVGGPDKDEKSKLFGSEVRVWDVASGKQLRRVDANASIWGAVAFSPDGKAVACGNECWELEADSGAKPAAVQVPGTGAAFRGVCFDRNGLFWCGSEDKLVHVRARKTGEERFLVRGCANEVLRVAVSPDGKEVAVAVGDIRGGVGAIQRFDVAAISDEVWRSPAPRNRVTLVAAVSPDGARFVACDFSPFDPAGSKLLVRDIEKGTQSSLAIKGFSHRAAFAPDGSVVAVVNDRTLQFIDASGKLERELPLPAVDTIGPRGTVICRSPDGRTIATVTCGNLRQKDAGPNPEPKFGVWLNTWDAATLKPGKGVNATLTDAVPPKARSPMLVPLGATMDAEGKRVAVAFGSAWESPDRGRIDYRGIVRVWELETGAEVFRQTTLDPLRAVAFAPDGTIMAVGGSSQGGIVYGWDLETGERTLVLLGHSKPILSLAFGPHGRVATGGADRAVKVWDLASRREILTLDGFARDVTHVTFTKNGANLVAATGIDPLMIVTMAGVPMDWPPAEVRVFRGPK